AKPTPTKQIAPRTKAAIVETQTTTSSGNCASGFSVPAQYRQWTTGSAKRAAPAPSRNQKNRRRGAPSLKSFHMTGHGSRSGANLDQALGRLVFLTAVAGTSFSSLVQRRSPLTAVLIQRRATAP